MRARWLLLLAFAASAPAQDPFEIQVYYYETVPKGMWNLETHLNYIGRGSKHFEGTEAPSHNQFHMTYELTHGITKHFEMAGYLVLARRAGTPGTGWDYAGWRMRPRVSLPKEWKLPMDVSIAGEIAFPRKTYEVNRTTLELRPILEKKLGRLQLDFNPTVGRALRGPDKSEGWDFEPAMRTAYEATRRLDVSLEYYGGIGPFRNFLPRNEQVHQFYPGGDFKVNENVVLNFGIGFGVTPSGNKLVYKMRVGYLFGKERM